MNGETSTRTSWQSFTATADPSAAAPRIAALRDLMAGHGLDDGFVVESGHQFSPSVVGAVPSPTRM